MLDGKVVVNLLPEFGVGVDLGDTAIDLVRLTNFINRLSFGVDCSKSARNEEPSSRAAFNSGLALGNWGLQLNLEIAQAVSQRRLSLSTGFQADRKCVEASDDVIENDLTTSVDNRK